MDKVDQLIEVVRKTVIKLFPELAGRYHLGARAALLSTADGLHIQPLTRDGAVDETAPAIQCDPKPYRLKAGNVLRMSYLFGDPSEPEVFPVSSGAVGTMSGSQVNIEGYGLRPAVIAEYLLSHTRLATKTEPVDEQGNPLPDATTKFIKLEFTKGLKDGDLVAAVPIEEGDRFIVLAKLGGI